MTLWKAVVVCTTLVLGVGCASTHASDQGKRWRDKEQDAHDSGTATREVKAGRSTRDYIVHLPRGWDGKRPLPVVLNFHGGGGNAEAQQEVTNMDATADEKGFMVVYPQGSGRLKRFATFNGGVCCGYARDKDIDDVAFTAAILDDLEKNYKIDARRIYVTGHSNGAIMAHRLGCELSDRIAAIAPVAGPMGIDDCSPGNPVSVLEFQGTADECAPMKGGKAKAPGAGVFRSTDSTIEGWVERNGCPSRGKPTYQKGPVTCMTHAPCRDDSEVILCTIEGGGHAWPGGTRYPAERFCGGKLPDVNANEMMWDFFERHTRKGAAAAGKGGS